MNYLIVFLALIAGESYGQTVKVVINDDGIEVDTGTACPPNGTSCFIKCCGLEQVIYKTISDEKYLLLCVNKTERELVDLSLHEDQLRNYSATMSTRKINDIFLYRKKRQFFDRIDVLLVPENEDSEIVFQNNSIQTAFGVLTPPIYCYEMIVNDNSSYYAYLINIDDSSADIINDKMITSYGGLVSAFFLFVTLIIHCLVKKLRQNMYSYLLMQFMVSLMLIFLIDFVITTNERWLQDRGRGDEIYKVCIWLSPMSYFLMLAAFFWMNAMCFEIWRNLSKIKAVTKKKLSVRAKIVYGLYAVGCPAVLTAVAVVIEYSDVPDNISKPAFATCMRDTGDQQARLYRFLPLAVLVSANILLYSHTLYKVCSRNKLPQGLTTTQTDRNRQQIRMYISLSVLMGVSWVLECMQMLLIDDIPRWLEYVIDVFNLYIGVIIFFITAFKRSVFVELCKRFNIDHRWVRDSPSTMDQSSKNSKSKGSYARTRATDDSIQFESINVSQDLDKTTPFVQTAL